jgi:hypothetical protein
VLQQIKKLGEIGLVKDTSDVELPPNAWTVLNNVRLINGAIENVAGYSEYVTPTGTPYSLSQILYDSIYYLLYASDTPTADGVVDAIYSYNGTTHTDISRYTTTPGDDPYTGSTSQRWGLTVLDQIPVLNNGKDEPQYWAVPGTGNLANLPYDATNDWSDVLLSAKVIAAYKNFLVAFNIISNVTHWPHMVWWSEVADPGSIPSTWDYTDATSLAGRTVLAGTEGHIVDAIPMRDDLLVYKTDAVYRMSFVGGTLLFRFQRIKGMRGALSAGCVAEIDGRHLVVGDGDIYIHDGQNPVSIAEDKYRDWFLSALNTDHYQNIQIRLLKSKSEAWIGFPSTASSGAMDKALIWNWVDNTASIRDLPNIFDMAEAILVQSPPTWNDWGAVTWNALASTTWDSVPFSPAAETILGAGSTIWKFESGLQAAGSNIVCKASRTGLKPGDSDDDSKFLLRYIYPRAYGSATLSVRVGHADTPEGEIIWHDPIPFVIGTDRRVSTRCKGRFFAIEFSSNQNASWRVDSYNVEFSKAGR